MYKYNIYKIKYSKWKYKIKYSKWKYKIYKIFYRMFLTYKNI